MNFHTHFDLMGKHAFLSASNYHWLNYTPAKLEQVYINKKRMEEGTRLHDLASELIERRFKLAALKKAFNMFVNDAIGFSMESEQVLYYSDNCFGTADAIKFKDNFLQIHDLKTGLSKPSFKQLDIYAALFCLEYGEDPHKIQIEQRLYQGKGYEINLPNPDLIADIMTKIVMYDKLLDEIKQNEL